MKKPIAYAVVQDLETDRFDLQRLQAELRAHDMTGAGTIQQAINHLNDAIELISIKYKVHDKE